MVITSRVRTVFFVPTSNVSETLIRLPPSVVGQYEIKCERSGQVVARQERPPHRANIWSSEEHELFLRGLELFPTGPWKEVAAIVGTKTTRQTMTHAQKYRQKIERRLTVRPTRKDSRKRLDRSAICQGLESVVIPTMPPQSTKDYPSHRSDNLLLCKQDNSYPLNRASVSSPMEVSDSDWLLDSNSFEQEFESLIASLQPLPMCL